MTGGDLDAPPEALERAPAPATHHDDVGGADLEKKALQTPGRGAPVELSEAAHFPGIDGSIRKGGRGQIDDEDARVTSRGMREQHMDGEEDGEPGR